MEVGLDPEAGARAASVARMPSTDTAFLTPPPLSSLESTRGELYVNRLLLRSRSLSDDGVAWAWALGEPSWSVGGREDERRGGGVKAEAVEGRWSADSSERVISDAEDWDRRSAAMTVRHRSRGAGALGAMMLVMMLVMMMMTLTRKKQ
jgi:hypothetical protein